MVSRLFFRSPLHEHADPAQRLLGVAQLTPESADLAGLLANDAVAEVRLAAAQRCASLSALESAWEKEADPAVRDAIAASLARQVSATPDGATARSFLASPACTDAIRAEVARQATDAERRLAAIAGLRDEAQLIQIATSAGHAETRLAAAECVRTPDGLRALAESARQKDRGVARLAKQRLEAMADREGQATEADAVLAQLEALAATPGPILSAVV